MDAYLMSRLSPAELGRAPADAAQANEAAAVAAAADAAAQPPQD
jgi:hypothetical protein